MKTKLIVLALCSALSFNAASAETKGSLGVGYSSDFYFRGSELSAEAAQLTLGVEADLGAARVKAAAFSNQSTGDGTANTNILDLSIGNTFADGLLSLYGGVKNIDTDGADSRLDVVLTAGLGTVLSPTVSIARDTDEDLWTYEACVKHTFATDVIDITLCGFLGSTDVTTATDRTYGGAGVTLSKAVGSVEPYASVKVIDAEDIERDTIVSAGITFNF